MTEARHTIAGGFLDGGLLRSRRRGRAQIAHPARPDKWTPAPLSVLARRYLTDDPVWVWLREQGVKRDIGQANKHQRRLGGHSVVEDQTAAKHGRNPLQQPWAHQPERRCTDDQDKEGTDLARARNLPLLARLLQASCRRSFSFFEVAFLCHNEFPVVSRPL